MTARIARDLDVDFDAVSTISGTSGGLFGYSVAGVGDVTGDGLPDLAVINADETLGGDRGAAVLLPGPVAVGDVDSRAAGVMLLVSPGDGTPQNWVPPAFGAAAALPDVTGDGVAELVLGNGYAGYLDLGTVWVVASPIGAPGEVIDLANQSWASFDDIGGIRFGDALAVGEVTGDGEADLVVGDPASSLDGQGFNGKGFVFGGPVHAGAYAPGEVSAALMPEYYEGDDPVGFPLGLGSQVVVADLDADGVDDVLLAAINSPVTELGDGYGRVYVWRAPILADIDTPSADAVYHGGQEEARLGTYAQGLGDTDGDGYGEVGLSGFAGDTDVSHGWVVNGLLPGDGAIADYARTDLRGPWSGMVPAAAGDLDEDGLSDVAMAVAHDHEGDDDGGVYVFYGPLPTGALPVEQCDHAFVSGNGNNNPTAIAAPGDVTGDGDPDLAIGLRVGNTVYLVPGGAL